MVRSSELLPLPRTPVLMLALQFTEVSFSLESLARISRLKLNFLLAQRQASKRRAVHIVLLVLIPYGQQNRPLFPYTSFMVACLPSDFESRFLPLAILRISSRSQKENRVPTLVGWGISPERAHAQTVLTLHPRMRATSLTLIRGQSVSEKFSCAMW